MILSGNKDGIQSAVLTIENVQLDDETFYNCCSVDIAVKDGNVEYNIVLESTFIRVRGSYTQRIMQLFLLTFISVANI